MCNDEHIYIVLTLSWGDAKYLADKFAQMSFFFGEHTAEDEVIISYYERTSENAPFELIEKTQRIDDAENFDDFFSKYNGLKWSFYLDYFNEDFTANEIINEGMLSKSLDDSYTTMARAIYRRRAYSDSPRLSEGGLSRLWQHTQGDSTFAIIGSQDKDTKEDRSDELLQRVSNLRYGKGDSRIGYKPLWGRYEYEDGTVANELSLMIFNLTKDQAVSLAKTLNQESIIWKDKDFFGFLTQDGNEDGRFSSDPRNINMSDEDVKLFGSRLAKHKNKNQQKWFKFVMEQYAPIGERNAVRNMSTRPGRKKEKVFELTLHEDKFPDYLIATIPYNDLEVEVTLGRQDPWSYEETTWDKSVTLDYDLEVDIADDIDVFGEMDDEDVEKVVNHFGLSDMDAYDAFNILLKDGSVARYVYDNWEYFLDKYGDEYREVFEDEAVEKATYYVYDHLDEFM